MDETIRRNDIRKSCMELVTKASMRLPLNGTARLVNLNNTRRLVKSEKVTLILGLRFFSHQLYHSRKKLSFSNNIEAMPFSVKPTKTLREEGAGKIIVHISDELRRHYLDGAAFDHTRLQLLSSPNCYGQKVSSFSNSHTKAYTVINDKGIHVLQ